MMNGLTKEETQDYWVNRSSQQGKRTVGFGGNNAAQQEIEYDEKISFVTPWVDPEALTLDYGCGVGRWSKIFNNYIGVDITQNLLDIAIKENPSKEYYQLSTPTLENFTTIDLSKVEQFFASTVLQHCDDSLCDDILRTFAKHSTTSPTFILYETSIKEGAYHNKGRTALEYGNMISKYFPIVEVTSEEHLVHNQAHTVSKIITGK
jgi:SAM-dependent methyltransferase